MCLYRLYISCWGWGIAGIGAWMMESFSFMKASWCSRVHSNFTCYLVSKVNGFAIFAAFLIKLSIVAYQSKKCTDFVLELMGGASFE